MKTLVRRHPTLLLIAPALAFWLAWATTNPALAELAGRGPASAIACLLCAGGGVAAFMYSGGSLAWVLWTQAGSATAIACGASCIAAVM
jgi:hypothetical protein